MAGKHKYLGITNFVGINTNADPRRLKPNKDDEGIAEAVEMINMDITQEGKIVTSNGFELVSEGVGTGGIKNLLNYDKDEDNKYLLITYGDHHYSITPVNSTWVDLGDYGTEADYVGGTIYKDATLGSAIRYALIGTNLPANDLKYIDIDNPMGSVAGGGSTQGVISIEFMGRWFVADGISLHYTAVEDFNTWEGIIGFNDIITGLKVVGQKIIVYTRTYHQGVKFDYDDTWNLSVPLKDTYERQFGCLAPKTVQEVGSDAYYWADRGIMRLGAELSYDDQGLPRPQSLSEKIEPSLNFINKKYRYLANSAYLDWKQQYWLAVPYGSDTVPSGVFVYNENWKAWTFRNGFYPELSVFRNSDYEQELYFGDKNSPTLYKFNDSYSYNGFGYTRRWKSKIFTLNAPFNYKRGFKLDIAGSMDSGTEFDVIIEADNVRKKYVVDSSSLESTATFGEYIGDNWIGAAWIGGEPPSESRFKRFYAPIDFDRDVREFRELQITIENYKEEQPFKIDFIGIEYEVLPIQSRRDQYVNRQKPA